MRLVGGSQSEIEQVIRADVDEQRRLQRKCLAGADERVVRVSRATQAEQPQCDAPVGLVIRLDQQIPADAGLGVQRLCGFRS